MYNITRNNTKMKTKQHENKNTLNSTKYNFCVFSCRFTVPFRVFLSLPFVFFSVLFLFLFVFIPIFTTFAANLYILPSSKDLNVGDKLDVSVYVDSLDQAMNAVSFKISYPENLLRFVSLSKTGTIINLWLQEPKGGNGEVLAEGIVLNPGFTGSRGKILNITFKALSSGKTDLSFVSGAVLANDGLGTNILKNMKGANYVIKERIIKEEKVIKKEVVEQPTLPYLPTPKIFSPTHPDQEKWYNNNNPVFEWRLPEGVTEVKLSYSEKPKALPNYRYSSPISQKKLENIKDGTYYFNVQFIGKGVKSEIARYKFNIDTKEPTLEEFFLVFTNHNSLKSRIKAKDELSGIDKIKTYLDNNLISATSSDSFEIEINNLQPGNHIFKAEIFDKAGNLTKKEETINVPTPEKKIEKDIIVQKDYTLYYVLLIVLILLIILTIFIYFLKHRVDVIHKEIRKEKLETIKNELKSHLLNSLQNLKDNIRALDDDLKQPQEDTKKDLYKEAKNILEESEKKIEEKLKELE
jgi:competence protein ComGC